MKKEHKSINVSDEELEEGSAVKGEKLSKRYNYGGIPKQTPGTAKPNMQGSGGQRPSMAGGMMKSIERTHGSQLAKSFPVGGTCGICNRVSKSIEGSLCQDCHKTISMSKWHNSHLG